MKTQLPIKRKGKVKMKETGLFYSDGSFQSDQEIKRRLALNGDLPSFETPLPIKRDFGYWTQRFVDRQREYLETDNRSEHVKIQFTGRTILNFIGDLHAGSPYSHYERIQQEAEVIVNTPNSYVFAMGDWVDGFFFNPAQFEQMEQAPQQFQYTCALLEYYAEHGRLLLAFAGQHDKWAAKSGSDPWVNFADRFGAHYMEGVGYVTAEVDGIEYKVTAAHRFPGNSIYNNTHPENRASKEMQGADIYVGADSHRKGISGQGIKDFGGITRWVNFISVGPYRPTDEYARKNGWATQSPKEMYGCAVVLDNEKKDITVYEDILKANASS